MLLGVRVVVMSLLAVVVAVVVVGVISLMDP